MPLERYEEYFIIRGLPHFSLTTLTNIGKKQGAVNIEKKSRLSGEDEGPAHTRILPCFFPPKIAPHSKV